MRRARILLILGVWVAVLPHLGFPSGLKNLLFLLTGVGLAYFGFILYRELKQNGQGSNGEESFDNFSENNFDLAEPASEEYKGGRE